MGIADFLAQAGQGTAIGSIAGAFGGRTAGQSALDNFTQNEVPALYDQAKAATTPEQLHQFLMDFTAKAGRAGYSPDAALKFAKEFVAPLSQGLQANALDQISQRFAPQTTQLTPTVAPQGQGQPLPEGTSFAPQTTPGRAPNTQDVMDIASALTRYGKPVEPAGFQQLLETPGKIGLTSAQQEAANAEAGVRKTQQSLDERQIKALESLPTTAGPGGVSPQQLGFGTKGTGLTGYMENLMPARPTASDILIPAKAGLLAAQTTHAQAATGEAGRGNRTALRDTGASIDLIDTTTGNVISSTPKTAKPEQQVTDAQLQAAQQKAQAQVTAILKNQSVLQKTGMTGDPNLAAAQATLDDLNQQIQQRRGGGGRPPPKLPGKPGPPKPGQAAAATDAEQRLRDKFKIP